VSVIIVQHTMSGYAMLTIPTGLGRKFAGEGIILDKDSGTWLVPDDELPRIEGWLRTQGHTIATPTALRQRPDPLPFTDQRHDRRQPDEVARRGANLARQALAQARARVDDDAKTDPPPRDEEP
jgi:hypothetical protein